MHKKVEKKLFNLCTGEFTATVMFIVVWLMYMQSFERFERYLTSYTSIYAFILLEFILLQGTYYWFLKWRQVKQKDFTNLPNEKLRFFAMFNKINLVLITIGLGIFIYVFIEQNYNLYWYGFLFIFAIIEYLNYYKVRLSYMSVGEIKEFIQQKGFRRSKLARELQSLK